MEPSVNNAFQMTRREFHFIVMNRKNNCGAHYDSTQKLVSWSAQLAVVRCFRKESRRKQVCTLRTIRLCRMPREDRLKGKKAVPWKAGSITLAAPPHSMLRLPLALARGARRANDSRDTLTHMRVLCGKLVFTATPRHPRQTWLHIGPTSTAHINRESSASANSGKCFSRWLDSVRTIRRPPAEPSACLP